MSCVLIAVTVVCHFPYYRSRETVYQRTGQMEMFTQLLEWLVEFCKYKIYTDGSE